MAQKSSKKSVVVMDGKKDSTLSDLIESEIEMIKDAYPDVAISGSAPRYTLKFSISSPTGPNEQVTLVIGLERYYPYQVPTISLETSDTWEASIMREDRVAKLYKDIRNNIKPCLESGMGCIMLIVRTVSDAIEEEESPPPKALPQFVLSATRAPGNSPKLTPIPMKEKDAVRLSVLTCHLLKKCCYLQYPESAEEGEETFQKLLVYLMKETSLIPYGDNLHPWKDEFLYKGYRKEIELSVQNLTISNLLKWLWKVPTGGIAHTTIKGRYDDEFIEQHRLGAGGFAPVFVCRKKLDGRQYAVKKIVMHKQETEKVLREVKTLANLNHKNIVRYYDAWVEDGYSEDLAAFIEDEEESEEESDCSSSTYSSDTSAEYGSYQTGSTHAFNVAPHSTNYQTLYIQMELCSSVTLRDLLDEKVFHTPNGVKVASSILRQLLSVIAHTHHEGIVHRDLKPENILFDAAKDAGGEYENATVRVVDFGLARHVPEGLKRVESQLRLSEGTPVTSPVQFHPFSSLTGDVRILATTSKGTVLYCAPELNAGDKCTLTVDEFSIGIIALEMWLTIEKVDFREIRSIITELWNNKNATLPAWFVKKNEAIAKIIGGLISHDPKHRLTCEEVLRDASLPGDPPDLVKALETIDRYGGRMVASVLQRIYRLEYQRRDLSKEEHQFNEFVASNACSQLTHVLETIGHLHGFISAPILKTHIPVNAKLQSVSQEYVVNSSGYSFNFSSFPHYAISSYLSSLKRTRKHSFMNFYCKDRPFLSYTTPYVLSEGYSELLAEPLYCLLHLLCCVRRSGTVQISVSQVSWMNMTMSALAAPLDNSPGSSTNDYNNSTRHKDGGTPNQRNANESSSGNCAFVAYDIPDSKSVAAILERVRGDMTPDVMLGLPNSDKHLYLLNFLTTLMEAVECFKRYMFDGLVVNVVIRPSLRPAEHRLPRDILLYDGVYVQCDVLDAAAANLPIPIAFGCSVDPSTSGHFTPLHEPSDECSAFVLSLDVMRLSEAIGTESLQLPHSFTVIDGVGFRPSPSMRDWDCSIIETAVSLWMGNIRACLACNEDEKKSSFEWRGIRYLYLGERSVIDVRSSTRRAVKKKPPLSGVAARQTFFRLAVENAESEEQELSRQWKHNAQLMTGMKRKENENEEEDRYPGQTGKKREKNMKRGNHTAKGFIRGNRKSQEE